jgi:hypothetical protein
MSQYKHPNIEFTAQDLSSEPEAVRTTGPGFQDPMLQSVAVGIAERKAAEADATEQRSGHPPRVPELHNQVKLGYIVPDPEVMQQIETETNGKVQYFATRHDRARVGSNFQGRFHSTVIEPLAEELAVRYPGKTLALRGVTTSINGLQPPESEYDLVLQDIVDTVETGTEKPGAVFNVAVLEYGEPQSVDRVSQYASDVAMRRFEADESPQADTMFPAILVYDTEGLQQAGGVYGVKFREDRDVSEVLLAAYVVDCPTLSVT